jgi:putative hemolysin
MRKRKRVKKPGFRKIKLKEKNLPFLIIIIFVIIVVVAVGSYFFSYSVQPPEPPPVGLPNPAAVFCEDQGGEIVMVTTKQGQGGFCVLEDKVCEEWAFFNKGTCSTPSDLYSCQVDGDCVKVSEGCCSCNSGGKAMSINSGASEYWNKKLEVECGEIACPAVISQHVSCFSEPKCVDSVCTLAPDKGAVCGALLSNCKLLPEEEWDIIQSSVGISCKEVVDMCEVKADFTSVSCGEACASEGYDKGSCKWPSEAESSDLNRGTCYTEGSKHCGSDGECNCYCYDSVEPPMTAGSLLSKKLFGSEARVYGKVSYLKTDNFDLNSGGKRLYVEFEGVSGINSSDWIVMDGTLNVYPGWGPFTFTASKIERIDYSSLEGCEQACLDQGYVEGVCQSSFEASGSEVSLGSCFVEFSETCGTPEVCGCFCS